MKKVLISLISIVLCVNLFSNPIDINAAKKVALNLYKQNISKHFDVNNSINITKTIPYVFENQTTFYIVNINDNSFVIVSAEDATKPILAYSYQNEFKEDKVSPELKYWLAGYAAQIKSVRESSYKGTEDILKEWNFYLTDENFVNYKNETKSASTYLVKSTWDQTKYYNALCPVDAAGPDGHVVTGCVATSIAQVIFYWRYPSVGNSSYSYSCPGYGTLSANFGTTTYDYNSMVNKCTQYNNEVAKLNYHCGVAVNMYYGPDGSGSMTYLAVGALKNYFKYSSSTTLKSRDNYTDANWLALIKTEVNAKRPMVYSGSSNSSGGHAWVCDGYDSVNYVHFNWGWEGYGDAFYTLANLNPLGNDFNENQQLISNIQPASGYPAYCSGTVNLTNLDGSITDGSGPNDYQNNADCSWLISIPDDSISNVKLYIEEMNLQQGDELKVYNGTSDAAPLLGTYTGSTLPSTITANSGKMFIKFISNSSDQNSGFFAIYKATQAKFCQTTTNLTAPYGNISDGSNAYKYRQNSICRWYIKPTGVNQIIIHFNSLDLATGDYIDIKDGDLGTIINTVSGTTIPADIVCNTGNVLVSFRSLLTSTTANGWDLSYSSTSGVNEVTDGVSNLNVYPNPANDIINISFNTEKSQNIKIDLYTITGQLVYSKEYYYNNDLFTNTINVADLPKGIYLLKIYGESSLACKKIVIK